MFDRRPSRTTLLIALLAGGVSFRDVGAVGLNLSWDDCGTNGVENRSFACDSDAGQDVIIASFLPPAGVDSLIGCDAVVDISSKPFDIPAWWSFMIPGCRETAMDVSFDPGVPLTPDCIDYWQGRTFHGWTYDIGFETAADRARLVASAGMNFIPPDEPGPVDEGTEYFAFRIRIDHTNTVGPGACAGCDIPICIVFNQIVLKQPGGTRDVTLTMPESRYHVIWQPPRMDCPAVVPARSRTWGSIKAIYR